MVSTGEAFPGDRNNALSRRWCALAGLWVQPDDPCSWPRARRLLASTARRDQPPAQGARRPRRYRRDQRRLCDLAAPWKRPGCARPAGGRSACNGARPFGRRRNVVELGIGTGARRKPAHRASGDRRQDPGGRPRPRAPLDGAADAGIPDNLLLPAALIEGNGNSAGRAYDTSVAMADIPSNRFAGRLSKRKA